MIFGRSGPESEPISGSCIEIFIVQKWRNKLKVTRRSLKQFDTKNKLKMLHSPEHAHTHTHKLTKSAKRGEIYKETAEKQTF